MTDRELRIVRARTRLAVAVEVLRQAAPDAGTVREDLADVIDRQVRSLVWMCGQLGKELEEKP